MNGSLTFYMGFSIDLFNYQLRSHVQYGGSPNRNKMDLRKILLGFRITQSKIHSVALWITVSKIGLRNLCRLWRKNLFSLICGLSSVVFLSLSPLHSTITPSRGGENSTWMMLLKQVLNPLGFITAHHDLITNKGDKPLPLD